MNNFYLQVQKVENKCLFQLSWSNNQKITAELPYPESIIYLYQEWQRAYQKFYSKGVRGKVVNLGTITPPPVDWQAQLVQAEAKLLYEFHQWLRSKELYDIRLILTTNNLNNKDFKEIKNNINNYLDIFISCNSPELIRLPWEGWEIGDQLSNPKVRIARQPLHINRSIKKVKRSPGKLRILAIFGDNTGLNFEKEKQAIDTLKKQVEVVQVDWQQGKDILKFKSEIVNNLTADKGWDILFFAGHSQETDLTGGQISIAPNATILLSEIENPLTTAIKNGLQFAVFNSCDGLSIANKLIDLGLSQVAVMREQVHNRVAEEIFVQFLNTIAQYKDVHQALLTACDYLKLEKNLTYPSAYLIPSLFRHPSAPLFYLEPFGFKQFIKRLAPTPLEAVTISALAVISLQLPLQTWLLEKRVLVQAMYRNLTNQVDAKITPPVLLVQIDNESINKAGILSPRPINREYMAQIIDKLVELKAPVVGIDYLLDRPDLKRDPILAKSIQTGFKSSSQSTRFVFITTRDPQGKWLSVHPQIASDNWSLTGEMEILPGWYMQLLPSNKLSSKPRAFGFMLALSQELQQFRNSPQPQLTSKQDLWQQVNTYINNTSKSTILASARLHLHPLTAFSYNLNQMWLHPIVDFSIPPKQVYQTTPAWKLLEYETISSLPKKIQQQIVIVAPGGYEEAGTGKDNEDNFELPAAMGYWRNQDNPDNTRGILTGGEVHAYMTHHYLNSRMVVPIPDLWMTALAILLGKITLNYLSKNPEQHRQFLILLSVASIAYALISLQLYISSAAILLPWLLPTTTFWFYILHTVYTRLKF